MSNWLRADDDPSAASPTPLINGSTPASEKQDISDLYDPTPLSAVEVSSNLHPSESSAYAGQGEGEYSAFVAYCVTVNYILGVGVIGMPKAYATGGWMLSTIVLFIVSIMATFTALWYVEVGHRAVAKEKQLAERGAIGGDSSSSSSAIFSSSYSQHNEERTPLSPLPLSDDTGATLSLHKPRRIEVNEMIGLFIGLRTRRIYEVLLCIYMMGSLWSYTSVFSTGMAANVPLPFLNDGDVCVVSNDRTSPCYGLYIFYNFLFACVVVPVACLKLTEMKSFVVALAMLRFVAITAMVLTTIEMMYHFPATDNDGNVVSESTSAPYYSTTPAFDWSGLGTIFPICIFAQIFHHSVPGIAYPLRNKKTVPKVFASCLFTMFSLYSGLAITLALYFGPAIMGQCTLNFKNYTGQPASSGPSAGNGWTTFLSYLIVLFPPADVLSAFPLKAITVGNNIMHSFIKQQDTIVRKKVIPFRLFAAVTPIVGACIFNDLTVLLTYTGSLGVVIAFLFPAWLQYKSQKELPGSSGVLSQRWDQVVNSRYAMYGVFAFCIAGLVAVLVGIITGASGH